MKSQAAEPARGNGKYSVKERKLGFLDPRTKLILLAALPTFLMSGMGGDEMQPFHIIFPLLSLMLLVSAGNIRSALVGFCVLIGTYLLWHHFAPQLSGGLYTILQILYGVIIGIVPCALMAVYAISTTTASEFISAMERLRIPSLITIPLSVMFRFFPTVREEAASINNAMRMRGIRIGGKSASQMLEYRMVPVLMCSLRIGDELSAASLSRGLGSPQKRTNICRLKFHVQDLLMLLVCAAALLTWILGLLGVYLW